MIIVDKKGVSSVGEAPFLLGKDSPAAAGDGQGRRDEAFYVSAANRMERGHFPA